MDGLTRVLIVFAGGMLFVVLGLIFALRDRKRFRDERKREAESRELD